MDERDGLPWVVVAEPLDRPLRLGPFASGQDAAKFVTAAAVGAVVSLLVEPWAGLPIVAVGALVSLWRPDGEALDERFAVVARWVLRRSGTGGPVSPTAVPRGTGGRPTVVRPDGRVAVVVRVSGVPLTFLPPSELARQFELYRELLRAVDGDLIVAVGSAPMHAESLLPPEGDRAEPDAAARAGYRELVVLLARRRSLRRVFVALATEQPGEEGLRRLDAAVDLLEGRLADLGVRSERLRGRALLEGAYALGWTAAAGGR